MLKAYEYRIYPTSQQEAIFNQTLGLCRLYWNIVIFNKNQNHSILWQKPRQRYKCSSKHTFKVCDQSEHSRLGTYRKYKCLWSATKHCEVGKRADIYLLGSKQFGMFQVFSLEQRSKHKHFSQGYLGFLTKSLKIFL